MNLSRWMEVRSYPFLSATAALLLISAVPAGALEPKATSNAKSSSLSSKEFFRPELYISSSHRDVEAALAELPNRRAWQDFQRTREQTGRDRARAFFDPRSGAATNLLPGEPLLPGRGKGNRVTLDAVTARLGYRIERISAPAVADVVRNYVAVHREVLGVELDQLGQARANRVSDELWHVRIPQIYRGIPVRHGHMAATINNGNLVLIGTETWGNVRGLAAVPLVTPERAIEAGFEYLGGRRAEDRIVKEPALEIVPTAPPELQEGQIYTGDVGAGYRHRLVYTFLLNRQGENEVWEILLDARSGEVLAFQDTNHYADGQITGAVYPVTSTEICPTAGTCGAMESGWPMPYADTGLPAPNDFTNSAGIFEVTGPATTTLSGTYVNIADICGTVSESGAPFLDLGGTNGEHDCTTPGGTSAGNTPAARTAFYELNKLIEQARGWIPNNTWLEDQLTANVNLNDTCNAFWSVFNFTVNFYQSGGGCRNTGELAGVFDHEWGHGLDDFDSGGALSNSSEAYADIVAIYRLQDSCVGHGFHETVDEGCGMTSDGTGFNSNEAQVGAPVCCTDCSGVRDADYARHVPATPATALGFVCDSCLQATGPCGRQVHCAAAPSRQAAWDFVARDLQSAPFHYDEETAFIVGNKVFYQGSGNIGLWHACTCGASSSGCGATNAYMQWLAADDDNGDLSDGTPHMTALFDAFDRHGIACADPMPQNSGCASGPTGSSTLSATPGNNEIALSWTPVAGASGYWVMRSEGHAGCNFGKALIATVAGTSYTDTEVANGRDYDYNIVAVGASDACYGPVSNCLNASPIGDPDYGLVCTPASLSIAQNETAELTCTVSSIFGFVGTADLACSGNPAGIGCSFSVPSVTPPVDGSADSTLTLDVDLAQATGLATFDVVATSGVETRTAPVSVQVLPEGTVGPQDATYDETYDAPACLIAGSSCDTRGLVDGRADLGAEPNQPNTIGGTCADGTLGAYHSDESNDRIVVSTLDGADFVEGATARIDATVWAWSDGSSDTADFYYAADADNPVWTHITSIEPPEGDQNILSATYTLPAGARQAVRVNFRYQGSEEPCSPGSYDDRDDLVFAVNPAPPMCSIDTECDDGLFCNGAETCNAGTCQAGSDPCPDSTCDDDADVCVVCSSEAPCPVFNDGFESGNTATWSTAVP